MKRNVSNYFWVGLFTLVITVLTLMAMIRMTGRQGQTVEYHSHYANVTGLGFGTPVYYEGYRIGQIESISPVAKDSGLRFKVSYSVQQGWQIRTDATAQIQSAGLLADMSININAGQASTFFNPGDEIPGRMPVDLFAQLGGVAEDIDDIAEQQLKPMLDNLSQRLDSITKQVDEGLPTIMANITEATDNINQVARNANQLLSGDNAQHLSQSMKNLSELTASMQTTLTQLDASMNNINDLITDARGLVTDDDAVVAMMLKTMNKALNDATVSLDSILSQIESASMNLNEATNEIRKQPNTLLFSKDQGEDEL